MGLTSIWHWIIVLVVILLLFGAGKIPRLMGDVAKGVKAFKKGLQDDDATPDVASQPQERKALEEGSSDTKVAGSAATPASEPRKDDGTRP